jgi:putative inorganic carbon (HCO3(-)) transporter
MRTRKQPFRKRLTDASENWNPDKWLFWAFVAMLVWAPIPLGSNRPWAWAILEAWSFVLFGAWCIAWAAGRAAVTDAFRKAWPVLALFILWLMFQALQFVPLPPAVVEALSSEAARMHALAASFHGGSGWVTLSVDPHSAKVAWLKGFAYFTAFVLTLLLVSNRSRVKSFAYAFVFAGLALSIYGVLMHLAEVAHEYFGTPIAHGGSASATYANRNHFAGYLEMVLAIGIGLLIASLKEGRHETWKQFFRGLIELVFSPKIRLRLYLSVMVIALVTTHSRMGNSAFFSSLLIAGIIGLAMSRHATRSTVILLVSLIAIDVSIVGSWFGVEKLAQRLEQTTMHDVEERQDPSQFALQQIREYPLFGSGAGSFYTVFPRYRGPQVVAYFEYAHDDYAQLAAENGVISIFLLGAIVVVSLVVALLAQWRRRDPLMRGMAFSSIMGVTAILIHSTVDFNLQIPANAMMFVVLLALAWISLHLGRRSHAPPPTSSGEK